MPTETNSASHDATSTSRSQGGAAHDDGAHDEIGQSPVDRLRELGREAAEVKQYAAHYLAAKVDRLKLSMRRAVLYAALGVVGFVAAAGMICTAAVLLITALGGLINSLIDRPGLAPWLGNLIVAVLFFTLLGLGIKLGVNRMLGSSRKRTVAKYENRQRQQILRYGHNVHERAQNV